MLENGMVLEMDRHLNSLEEQEPPICPVCEYECETFYYGIDSDIIGCENCVSNKDAWQVKADENI